MSFAAMAWASKVKTGSPTRKLILLLLADRASDDGTCYPSVNTIADDCELGRNAVIRNIKQLEKGGFLTVNRRRNGTTNLVNTYTLHVDTTSTGGSGASEGLVVSQEDHPSALGGLGVVPQGDSNLSVEPINEPIIPPISPKGELKAGSNSNSDRPEKPTASGTGRASRKFVPPCAEVVCAYMKERTGAPLTACMAQADKFVARNEAGGWMVGRNKMKDWKGAVRYWIANDYDKVFTKAPEKKRLQI